MVMTPLELKEHEFKKAFRGYAEEEVDDFLERVIKDYEDLYRENLSLKEQIELKEGNIGQYRNLEETLKSTLVVAQQTAQDLRFNAEREVEVIKASAHKDAATLIKESQLKAEEIINQAREEARAIIREYEDVQKRTQILKVKLRSFLKAQLELVDEAAATIMDDEGE
ncbi:MAG: DivIVA domain-containing protein [Clostridia bacterium]|nr:DivIVA domain-containing protein [Clostridia bacterium]